MTFMAVILLFIFFVLFFLYFWGLNPQMVTIFYLPEHSLTHPAAIIVIVCIIIGLILGFGAHIYSTLAHWIKHWNRDRSEKKQREISATYREGVGRLLSGDLKKARILLKKTLDRDPKRVDTLIAMASLASQEGNPTEGLELLRRASEFEPKGMEVLFKTAAIQEEIGKDEDAMASYKSLIALEKDNRKALRSLRDLYIKHNNWQEALESQVGLRHPALLDLLRDRVREAVRRVVVGIGRVVVDLEVDPDPLALRELECLHHRRNLRATPIALAEMAG